MSASVIQTEALYFVESIPKSQSVETLSASAIIGSSKSGTRRFPLSIRLIAI